MTTLIYKNKNINDNQEKQLENEQQKTTNKRRKGPRTQHDGMKQKMQIGNENKTEAINFKGKSKEGKEPRIPRTKVKWNWRTRGSIGCFTKDDNRGNTKIHFPFN